MHEWSLVFFTLLIQSAAGLVFVGEIIRATAKGRVNGQLSKQYPVAIGLVGLGLALSLTHLGNPLHSIFAIININSSWLSREIGSTGLFFALLVVTAFMGRKGHHNSGWGAITAIVGLITVFVMSRVYMLPSVPTWDSGATPLAFFGSVFFVGAILCALLMSLNRQSAEKETAAISFGVVVMLAALGIIMHFIGIPMNIMAGSDLSAHRISPPNALFPYGESVFYARMVLLAAGGILFSWGAVRAIMNSSSSLAFVVMAAICAIAGEVIGRVLFYSSYTRIGL